jgi:hypothetical protein
VVTICTTWVTFQKLYLYVFHIIFRISSDYLLKNIKRFMFLMERKCALCKEGNVILNILWTKLLFCSPLKCNVSQYTPPPFHLLFSTPSSLSMHHRVNITSLMLCRYRPFEECCVIALFSVTFEVQQFCREQPPSQGTNIGRRRADAFPLRRVHKRSRRLLNPTPSYHPNK